MTEEQPQPVLPNSAKAGHALLVLTFSPLARRFFSLILGHDQTAGIEASRRALHAEEDAVDPRGMQAIGGMPRPALRGTLEPWRPDSNPDTQAKRHGSADYLGNQYGIIHGQHSLRTYALRFHRPDATCRQRIIAQRIAIVSSKIVKELSPARRRAVEISAREVSLRAVASIPSKTSS